MSVSLYPARLYGVGQLSVHGTPRGVRRGGEKWIEGGGSVKMEVELERKLGEMGCWLVDLGVFEVVMEMLEIDRMAVAMYRSDGSRT